MDPLASLLLGLLLGLALGLALGAAAWRLVLRGRANDPAAAARAAKETEAVRTALTAAERERAALSAELAAAEATVLAQREHAVAAQAQNREHLDAQQDQIRELQEQQRLHAERERHDARILQTLSPVAESLQAMQKTVAELERERSVQFGSITEQLTAARSSGEQIRATAETLASALRSNNVRGVWGETQLRNVVEAAGLTQHVDFELQHALDGEAGAGRADMVVRLPGGKTIAIDAKVPFSAYLEASAIPAVASPEEEARRRTLLGRHVRAVRAHIDALAARSYWSGLDSSPEFVVAFIPSESLLASALEADPSLLEYSFRKRVALASPVNLWAVLKTVAFTWQQDVLTDDAKRLFDLGKTLYQRLSLLAEHSDALRSSIEKTVDNYNRFAASLESRVLVTARQLDALDESRVIGEPRRIESVPRTLTAVEFQEAERAS